MKSRLLYHTYQIAAPPVDFEDGKNSRWLVVRKNCISDTATVPLRTVLIITDLQSGMPFDATSVSLSQTTTCPLPRGWSYARRGAC